MSFFDQARPDFSLHIFGNEAIVDYEGRRWCIPVRLISYVLGHSDIPAKMIPPGLVAHGIHNNRERWFYHQKPVNRPIHLHLGQPRSFDFSWPDLLFVMTKGKSDYIDMSLRVFTFQGPLTPETRLSLPPLPNIECGGGICMGSIKAQTNDPAQFVNIVFFKSVFTHLNTDFEHIKEPIGDYLFGIRKTGWNFDDLPFYATFKDLMEGSK